MCACADHSIWTCLMVQGTEGLKQQYGDQHSSAIVPAGLLCNCTAIVTG